MKLRIAMLLMILVGSTTAMAHEGEHHHEGGEMPAGDMMGGDRTMFKAGGIGTIALVGADLGSIGVAYLPIDHMMIAAALSLTYNGNNPTGTQWSSGILLAVEYMIHDMMPFAMGPAFAFRGNFAPGTVFSSITLLPSWDLWYTPFNAPLAIGTGLTVAIQLNSGASAVVSLLTPGMRVAYTF